MFEWLVIGSAILLSLLIPIFIIRRKLEKKVTKITEPESKPSISTPKQPPTPTKEKGVISERDKPFILALISSGITILNILITSYGAYKGNQLMVDTGMDMLKFTFPMTTMAWTFYFVKGKNNGAKQERPSL